MFLIAIFFFILLLLSLNQQHILLYSYSLLIYEFYNILLFLSFYNKLYEPPSLKLNILHRTMPRKLLKAPIHIQVLLISLEKLLLLQLLSFLTPLYTNTLLLNILYITFSPLLFLRFHPIISPCYCFFRSLIFYKHSISSIFFYL